MTSKPLSDETEIELLKKGQVDMATDIFELKNDVKDIKEFLMGQNPQIVTSREFELYKLTVDRRLARNNGMKWLIGIVTAVITATITLLIAHVLSDINAFSKLGV